jgi:hypothetical protein
MKEDKKIVLHRRGFLRALTTGGLVVAASSVPFENNAAAATLSYDERRKPLYRESDEVKTFYRVNRYPR